MRIAAAEHRSRATTDFEAIPERGRASTEHSADFVHWVCASSVGVALATAAAGDSSAAIDPAVHDESGRLHAESGSEPADSVEESVQYAVGRPFPLDVGAEDYQDKIHSLHGLEGVYLNLDYVVNGAKKNETPLGGDFLAQAHAKFEAAGLKIFTKDEVGRVLGQPELVVFPTFGAGAGKGAIYGTPETGNGAAGEEDERYVCRCEASSYWASFVQGGSPMRQPMANYRVGTWGMGKKTDQCEYISLWMEEAVLEMLDKFLADYVASRGVEMTAPAVVAQVEDIPESCDAAWTLYLDVFAGGSTEIHESVSAIFDSFADAAKRCDRYGYLIETHADKRASTEFNDMLSAMRAFEIKLHLLRRGVPADRIQTRSYGERKLLALGDTEADHARNRRVVITPYPASHPIVESE